MYEVTGLPAFDDNYIWLGSDGTRAFVVDPGDAAPVEAALAARSLRLEAILLTHHHADHVGGAMALADRHGATIHAPRDERIARGERVGEGDVVTTLGATMVVFGIPGHTRTHVAFHDAANAKLYCGDTLFGAGCGRLFEGTPAQMYASLSRLASLAPETAVYCGHEYTVANLRFARAIEPDDRAIDARLADATARRARGEPTLPSTIALERATNPFLRCDRANVRQVAERHAGRALNDEVDVFAVLREWKDGFR